jgi:hypothetical protein
MEVAYEFYKGEEQTFAYPGSPDEVEIESVEVGGYDIYNLLSPDQLHDIEYIILEKI